MSTKKITIEFPTGSAGYDITIAYGALSGIGKWARRSLSKDAARIAVVSNPTVFKLYGEQAVEHLRSAGFDVFVWLMKDGEVHKSFRNVERALDFFAASDITRTDAVLALGGGVVGDLAGFAAAVYLRGIAFLQVPTTLLSMIDSSVGGKTGVNSAAGKNRIGSFHQPSGVLIDTGVLKTLPERELTAGFCEAIKHGSLSGKKLLEQISAFLEDYRTPDLASNFDDLEFRSRLDEMISEQVSFKASIVQADERESTRRTDARSRKILNFGHTLAHALEKVTDYKYFKHGEAVGYGIKYACELSKTLALIDENIVNLLNGVVHRAGTLPPVSKLDPEEVFEAFRFDKKLVAGSLQMILLKGIGKPVIVNGDDIKRSTHIRALKKLLNQ
jgi:3-dehydroquinate synthase